MKRILSLSLFIATVYALSACNKNDETTNPSPSATEGVLRCTNRNSYTVYIDGIYVNSLPGKTFEEYKKTAGTYTVKAEQNEGYLLYPTIVERNILINAHSQVEFIFP